ncbi:hypothetical protein [Saccharothrix sp. Mg75]|uniref:hypothetical protein n=1 Tax=Saccharothrix sp. Mg75 TaxID=3445357 RepID=UPI003EF081F0
MTERSRGEVWVQNPPCAMLLERVAAGAGVAMAKRTHGVWDHLSLLTTGGWRADSWRRCDQMIFKQVREFEPSIKGERREYMRYLNELLDDVVNPPRDPRWLETISLDLDYLTKKLYKPAFRLRTRVDPRLLAYWQWQYSYADLIGAYGLATREFHFAQMLTQGVISLSILELPDIARSCHVIVVGPEKTRDLASRWRLDDGHFSFIPAPDWPSRRPDGNLFSDPVLPALQTFRIRHELLAELKSIKSARPLLYLFELGTCAQWLIARLFRDRPSASYLDLGRTLELWFPDSAWPLKKPVSAFYRRAARAYYGDRRYTSLVAAS